LKIFNFRLFFEDATGFAIRKPFRGDSMMNDSNNNNFRKYSVIESVDS